MQPLPAHVACAILLETCPEHLVANLLLYPGLNAVWTKRKRDRPDEYDFCYLRDAWERRWMYKAMVEVDFFGWPQTVRKFRGQFHSFDDLPAFDGFVFKKKQKQWYKHGKLHRDNDLPAVITDEGTPDEIREWYIDGRVARPSGKPILEYRGFCLLPRAKNFKK